MSKIKGNSDLPTTTPAEPSAPTESEFELALEDTVAQQRRGLAAHGRKGAVSGYNPYNTPVVAPDAAKPVAASEKRKPTDLRKLSEWIRLQRQVEALKKQDPESDPE